MNTGGRMTKRRCADSEMEKTFVTSHQKTANCCLRRIVPKRGERLLYCDHIERDGEGLFRLACENDFAGIVANGEPYLVEHTSWLKIRNHNYSQWVGREELFERERGTDPDFQVWTRRVCLRISCRRLRRSGGRAISNPVMPPRRTDVICAGARQDAPRF